MALLAKYYLTYSSPMGMEYDLDPVPRRTYHADAPWRPSFLASGHNNGPTSVPNSPRVPRKSTWHSTGNRSSCDSGDCLQTVQTKTPQRSYSVRRVGSARRASPFHGRRDVAAQSGGAASAPTSPHFGINKSESSTKLPVAAQRGEKSMPSSPLQNGGEHGHAGQSPPTKGDSTLHRRSHYASLHQIKKNQSFTGASEFIPCAGTPSPPHSGGPEAQRSPKEISEGALTRRRCTSGPLTEDAKLKDPAQPKIPELLITLSYSKNSSFVTITINKARNLSENSGAFVRVHLYDGFKPISLKQTNVVRSGANAEFKQAFVFSLCKDALWATHILVELFEYDVIGNECKYGDVVIGPKTGGNGFLQWRQVCTHPNIPCSMWHSIM